MNAPARSTTARLVIAALVLLLAGAGTAFASTPLYRLLEVESGNSVAAVDARRIDLAAELLDAGAEQLGVELFDGLSYTVSRYDLERRGAGDLAWRGRFDDGGLAVLTLKHGFVVGALWSPDGLYEITTDAAGQVLQKLDPEAFPPCAHGDRPEPLAAPPAAGTYRFEPEAPGRGRGTTIDIDVMSVYTPQAQSGAGGQAQIEATIQAAVDLSNTSFMNSDVDVRFTLVHTEQVAYNDSGNVAVDRQWVRNDPGVQALRDEHRADLVGLIVNNGGGAACGIAYLLGNEDPAAFEPNGYQVTVRFCAVGNLTYPHEHGHNMGAQHNPQNGAPPGSAYQPYAYGHYVDGSYRTVMSYSNPCTLGCTRNPYWSNPNVEFMGAPTGIADQRENWRVLNEVGPYTAAYRGNSIFLDGFESGDTSAWSNVIVD